MPLTVKWSKYLGLVGGVVAALGLMLAISQLATSPNVVEGVGEGSPVECNSPTTTVNGTEDLATYNAGTGNVVTGVCIKSGTNVGHTGKFTSDTTVEGCYTISGIGTQTVTVTRIGSGPTCQGISHIDVFVASATATPTAEVTLTPTSVPQTSTATAVLPTSTATSVTGQVLPTNTPVSGGFIAPTATSPSGGVQGGTAEVQGATQQGATQQGATPQTGVAGSGVQRLPSTGSADTRGDDTLVMAGMVLTVIGALLFGGSRLVRRETSS